MWSCRESNPNTAHTSHRSHTPLTSLTHTAHITSLTHRIYNIKYYEVIHKKYQIYRARNYLDVRASQSALTITLSVYVNELLCPVPLFCLSLCHTIVSSMCSLVPVVWVAWHTCLPSVWLGLTCPYATSQATICTLPYYWVHLGIISLATLYSCIATNCHIVIF